MSISVAIIPFYPMDRRVMKAASAIFLFAAKVFHVNRKVLRFRETGMTADGTECVANRSRQCRIRHIANIFR